MVIWQGRASEGSFGNGISILPRAVPGNNNRKNSKVYRRMVNFFFFTKKSIKKTRKIGAADGNLFRGYNWEQR